MIPMMENHQFYFYKLVTRGIKKQLKERHASWALIWQSLLAWFWKKKLLYYVSVHMGIILKVILIVYFIWLKSVIQPQGYTYAG